MMRKKSVGSNRNETGATLVIVAASLFMLIGFAALAIDAGLGYDDRRGTQNAADNAALAAAWEDCNPVHSPPNPVGEARARAATHGYNDAASNVSVEAAPLGGGQWEAVVEVENRGIFGPATPFAGDELTIRSEAIGSCEETQFLGGKALFAGALMCNPVIELNMSGSSIDVDGGIFSNGSLTINASSGGANLNGTVEHGDPANSNVGTQYPDALPVDYPLDITIGDYAPGGSKAVGDYFSHNGVINNNWMVNQGYADDLSGNAIEITQPGIYFTSSRIDFHDVSAAPGVDVTFVARGQIDLNGSDLSNLSGYSPIVAGGSVGLLMFSDFGNATAHENPPNGSCSGQAAINIRSANFSPISGVIFAPHGSVDLSNSIVDLDGSIIAFVVKTSGSAISVDYQDDPAFEPEYIVELVR